jgi:hypothetical protein
MVFMDRIYTNACKWIFTRDMCPCPHFPYFGFFWPIWPSQHYIPNFYGLFFNLQKTLNLIKISKKNCGSFRMVFNCISWINMLAILLVSFWSTYEIVLINLTFSHNDLSHNFNFVHTLHNKTFPTCGTCPWNDLFATHGQGFYLGLFDCYKENILLHIQ